MHSLNLEQDLRSDRQPEFTQLDMELAFMDQAAIIGVTERLMAAVFREVCLSQPLVHSTRERSHMKSILQTRSWRSWTRPLSSASPVASWPVNLEVIINRIIIYVPVNFVP